MPKSDRRARSGRGARRRWGLAVAAVVVVLAAVLGYLFYRSSDARLWRASERPGQAFPDQGNRHIQTVSEAHEPYNSAPPTSGPHLPYIAPWGVHTRPIAPELQVHNLEDGGVLVQYSCECPDLVAKLAAIVGRYDKQVILAPYPGMKSRIALTAWTRLETLDDLDEARVTRFIQAYRGIDHHK